VCDGVVYPGLAHVVIMGVIISVVVIMVVVTYGRL
jgi:hypothetical protein